METVVADEVAVRQPEFGRRLRECRERAGRSQRSLASPNVTASYISLLEAGQRVPSLNVVILLARALDVPVEELVGPGVLPPSTESHNAVLLAQMRAQDARDLGDHAQAKAALTDALARARATGNDELLFQLGLSLQDVLAAAGEPDARLAVLDDLLALPTANVSPLAQTSLLTAKASVLRDLGRSAEARRVAENALAHTDDPAVFGGAEHVRLLSVLVSVLCELGALDEVDSRVTELLDIATALGQSAVAGRAHWTASMAYTLLERRDDAHDHLRDALRELPYPAMPVGEWLRFCRAAATILLDLGRDIELAGRLARGAESVGQVMNSYPERVELLLLLARFELMAGNDAAALENYRKLDELTPPSDVDIPVAVLARLQVGRAEVLRGLGRPAEAAEAIWAAARQYEEQGAYQMAARMWRWGHDLTGQ
jgi:transcriptional regulator with XRE-family HTH domain